MNQNSKTIKKIRTVKKITAIILLAALFIILLFACGNDDGGNGVTPGGTDRQNQANQGSGQNQTGGEEEKVQLRPDLPDVYYDKYVFTILSTVDRDFFTDYFLAEEINGDIINDAIFNRNTYVEEKYGVKINSVILKPGLLDWSGGAEAIRKSVMSGSFDYDAGMIWCYDAGTLATEGLLLDLNNLSPLNLSKPWWDQRINEELIIKNKMFFTVGDISMQMNDAVISVLFNKQIKQDFGIDENFYELAKNGKWTLDKLGELARIVSVDMNGDGIMDQNDQYGLLVTNGVAQFVISSAGEKCATVNSFDKMELTLYTERTLSAFNKYMEYALDTDITVPTQIYSPDAYFNMFKNNQGLFLVYGTKIVPELRSMENDFGILPMPKLDEKQSRYYSPSVNYWTMFICVPNVQENPQRTAVILEALAAESRYTLLPAYYEKSLMSKHVRDEESREMLELMFDTRTYDIGWYYKIGNYDVAIAGLFANRKTDFTSMYEKTLPSAEAAIANINAMFDEFVN